jgi:hypothetical protein
MSGTPSLCPKRLVLDFTKRSLQRRIAARAAAFDAECSREREIARTLDGQSQNLIRSNIVTLSQFEFQKSELTFALFKLTSKIIVCRVSTAPPVRANVFAPDYRGYADSRVRRAWAG